MTSTALNDILGTAGTALKKIFSSPEKLVLASLCDALFFVVYGFITAPLLSKLLDYVIIIGSVVSERAPGVLRGASAGLSGIILDDATASSALTKILFIFLLLALATYVIYSFFQGISWKLSSDIAGRKNKFYVYMKSFALLNIFWIIIFSAQHLFSLFSDLRDSMMNSMQVMDGMSFSVVSIVIFLTIFYFAFISYTLLGTKKQGIKKGLKTGFQNAVYFVPAYLVIAIVYYIFKNLTDYLGTIDIGLMIFVGLITIIPTMTWARVYLMLVLDKTK